MPISTNPAVVVTSLSITIQITRGDNRGWERRSDWRHGTINVSPGPLERCRHSRGFPHASMKATDSRWRYLKCLTSTSAAARAHCTAPAAAGGFLRLSTRKLHTASVSAFSRRVACYSLSIVGFQCVARLDTESKVLQFITFYEPT